MARFFTLFSIAVIALAGFAQASQPENGGTSVGQPEGQKINGAKVRRDPGPEDTVGTQGQGQGEGELTGEKGEGEGEGGSEGDKTEGEGEGEGAEGLKKREDGETCDGVV